MHPRAFKLTLLIALMLLPTTGVLTGVTSPTPRAAAAPPAVAGSARLYVAGDQSGRVDVFDSNGNGEGGFPAGFTPGDRMAIGDPVGIERDFVVVGGDQSGRIDVFEVAKNGQQTATFPAGFSAGDALALGDLDGVGDANGDSRDEILIAGDQGGQLDAFNVFGDVERSFDVGFSPGDGFAVGDLDGDGTDEIVVTGDQSGDADVIDGDGTTLATFDVNFSPGDGLAIGDVDADGNDEIVVAGEQGGLADIFGGDGTPVASIGVGFTGGDAFAIGGPNGRDIDRDGIPDHIERFGIRNQGAMGLDLAALGASPCRKSVVIEIDYMRDAATGHDHRPSNDAITTAKAAFDSAPVPKPALCPYPGADHRDGVDLAIRVDDADNIPEIEFLSATNDGQDMRGAFGRIKLQHFLSVLQPYVRYSLWGHQQGPGNGSSGVCCFGADGKDFLVSLGGFTNYGSPEEQAGTLLHELGHSLGLSHGGGSGTDDDGDGVVDNDAHNYKPNYLSVMNYWFQLGGLVNSGGNATFDYSREPLGVLDLGTLDESAGIGLGTPYDTAWTDPNGVVRTGAAAGAIDWTQDDRDGNGVADDDDTTSGGQPLAIELNGNCVDAGPDVVLSTSAAGDDVPAASGLAITRGPDFTCNSVAVVDEQVTAIGASGATCVTAWPDNVLSTTPSSDDVVVAGTSSIGPGANSICSTIAVVDFQTQPVGVEQRLLHGYDDWDHVNLAVPAVAGPGPRPEFHDELTFEEAEAIQQMWDQALSPDQTVSLGPLPADTNDAALGVAVVGDRLYATHTRRALFGPPATEAGELVVYDRSSLAEVGRVTVGFDSRAVAVNPNTARAYVVNRQSQTLSVIDTNTLSVVATIPIGLSPIDVEVNTSTNRVYVGNHVKGLLVIDGATNTIVQTVDLGRGALGMAVDEASGTIYMAMNNQGIPPLTNSLNVLVDNGQQVTLRGNVTIGPGPSQPIDVAVEPARGLVYVANLGSSSAPPSVTVLDTTTLQTVATTPLTGPARAVALDAEAGRLIVATDGGVRIVDTAKFVEVRHIPAGFGPMAVAVPSGAHRELFTTNRAGQLVRRSYSSGTPTAAAGPS